MAIPEVIKDWEIPVEEGNYNSEVAQWQCISLLMKGLLVRVQPSEPIYDLGPLYQNDFAVKTVTSSGPIA